MPEGWKYWDRETNEVTSEFFDYSSEHYKMADALEYKILPLMREMAEALEPFTKVRMGWTEDLNRATKALKKFKEWK